MKDVVLETLVTVLCLLQLVKTSKANINELRVRKPSLQRNPNPCHPCTCSCETVKPKTVNCNHHQPPLTSLPSFPSNLTATIRTLSLDNNRITNLKEKTFVNFTALEVLLLSNNSITKISKGAFDGLQRLKILDLSSNKINKVENNTFQKLDRLEELNLVGNGISNISSHAFRDLKNLMKLILSDNKIWTISDGVFQHLVKLKYLSLLRNNIVHVSANSFTGMQNLIRLNLQGNKIRELTRNSFNGLFQLRTLLFADNLITSIDEPFKDLVSLRKLSLKNNTISSISRQTFLNMGKLNILNLGMNRLQSIPRALWISGFSGFQLFLGDNAFPCSCRSINQMKQLGYNVRHLQPSANQFKDSCSNISSVCEDERNFALGMEIENYGCDRGGDDLYNVIDNDAETFGSCFVKANKRNALIRVNLPGIIVVTSIAIKIRSDSEQHNITVKVGDKMSETYEPCYNDIVTNHSVNINKSCDKYPEGRDVRVWLHLTTATAHNFSLYKVEVKGYEKSKYNLWTKWSSWSPCSTTCNTGIKSRERVCTNPTSVKCLMWEHEGMKERGLVERYIGSCNLKPCPTFETELRWIIASVCGVFVLTLLGIVIWYRKFKRIVYFDGLRPSENFELDPNKTLLEQIEELPYDVHWEFPRYDIKFGNMVGEGHFGKVWHATAKGIKVSVRVSARISRLASI